MDKIALDGSIVWDGTVGTSEAEGRTEEQLGEEQHVGAIPDKYPGRRQSTSSGSSDLDIRVLEHIQACKHAKHKSERLSHCRCRSWE